MPAFGNKYHPNPQMGKALFGGGSSDSAGVPPPAGSESPAEEALEPATITCPECGASINLTASQPEPAMDMGDESGSAPAPDLSGME